MFKRLLVRLFPKWFSFKCDRLIPSRYALLELFGHVAVRPANSSQTEPRNCPCFLVLEPSTARPS